MVDIITTIDRGPSRLLSHYVVITALSPVTSFPELDELNQEKLGTLVASTERTTKSFAFFSPYPGQFTFINSVS